MKKYNDFKQIIARLEADADKFYNRGNNAAGTRLRRGMQKLRILAQSISVEIAEDMNLADGKLDPLNTKKVIDSNSQQSDKKANIGKKARKITAEISGTRKKHNIYYEITDKLDGKKDVAENLRTVYIIWDDIVFEKDRIKFSPNRIDAILPSVEFKGVFEDLNNLKLEYFNRLYGKAVYKLQFDRSGLRKDKSPDWIKICATIEIGKEFFQFKMNEKSSFGPSLTTKSMVKLYKADFERNQFLKFLASMQEGSFKLIPIIESINGRKEESFIFRLKSSKNKILLVWENTNDNRASHVFINSHSSHEKDLQKLESFICTPMRTKRASLFFNSKESNSIKLELNYMKPIRHTTLEAYTMEIYNLIRTY